MIDNYIISTGPSLEGKMQPDLSRHVHMQFVKMTEVMDFSPN